MLDKNFELDKIVEINWEQFLRFKRWHKTMRAWNISINKDLIDEGKIIYSNKPILKRLF